MADPQITHYFPPRIQLRRTKGWRMPQGAVKVDRTTIFGNPWKAGEPGMLIWPGCTLTHASRHWQLDEAVTPVQAVTFYAAWLINGGPYPLPSMPPAMAEILKADLASRLRVILDALPDLHGRPLACWCQEGAPCHAHVLIDLANGGAA